MNTRFERLEKIEKMMKERFEELEKETPKFILKTLSVNKNGTPVELEFRHKENAKTFKRGMDRLGFPCEIEEKISA